MDRFAILDFHLTTLLNFQLEHRHCKIQIHIKSWFPKMTFKIFVEKLCHNWFECLYFLLLQFWYWLVMSLFIMCNIGGTCNSTQIVRISQWSVVQSHYMNCWIRFGWVWQLLDLKKSKDLLKVSSKSKC